MNQLQNNQLGTKTQRHPGGLPITLDLSDPEPVRDIKPALDLGLPLPLHELFHKSFPALFEKELEK